MIWVIGFCDNRLLGTSPIDGMNGRMFSPAALSVATELIGGVHLAALGHDCPEEQVVVSRA